MRWGACTRSWVQPGVARPVYLPSTLKRCSMLCLVSCPLHLPQPSLSYQEALAGNLGSAGSTVPPSPDPSTVIIGTLAIAPPIWLGSGM